MADQALPAIPGYTLTAQLYVGRHTAVYRAEHDGESVVIKVLRSPSPSINDLVRFRNQYVIAQNLNSPGIIKPLALVSWNHRYALVMEDVGAITLRDYLQNGDRLAVEQVLTIALQLADSLHHLNQHRVLHKDINPSNILIHPDTHQVWLTDFSLASLLPKESQELQSPNALEGTLAYIAPEQTGRMNRGIDYRADFYSLGVTLYELLTGELPFQSNDPMELIHCHIAKEPSFEVGRQEPGVRSQELEARSQEPGVRSQELGARSQKPGVRSQEARARSQESGGKPPTPHSPLPTHDSPLPTPLSKIVLKLMAKNAEDRYQSALGLKHDLQQCLDQWRLSGQIEAFELGQADRCDRFLIPEKLYGREAEVQTLLEAFDRVSQGASELFLVAGYSGVGKTAVVNEVHKPITRQKGYFIQGKFDQLNRNVPFSAFVQALRSLMEQLLSESDAQLQRWQVNIRAALGDNGQVLIDVIPELEKIIGSQPPVPELSGSAAQNRFNLLFEKFIAVFATPDHPLVVFLDDLQWVDSASLNLLTVLMDRGQTGALLLLGAYRDNEVFPAHPLMLALGDLEKQNANIATITLAPLAASHINQLVADILSCSLALATPLTEVVFQETRGNPFFTVQLLKGLHQDGLITFDRTVGHWECDLVQVRAAALTDDVVGFMIGRLDKLPNVTQNVLKLAACIGNQFDLETLAIICKKTFEEVAADLWGALHEGLMLPQSQTYKFFQGIEDNEKAEKITVGYRFLHDRVQQAAYALIPDQQKQITHYQIGQRLLQNIPSISCENRIFEIVNQLNCGIDLLRQPEDKAELARLNLLACRKAKSATAYRAGREYARQGLSVLGENPWQKQYEITLALSELAAEFAALGGDWEAMNRLVEDVIVNSHSLVERTNVYRLQIQTNTSRNQSGKSIAIALEFLQQLGVIFPDNPTEADTASAIDTVQALIGNRQVEDLLDLPVMQDAEKIAIMQIANSIFPATYISKPSLYPLVVCLSVSLSIQYGNTVPSSTAYANYGMLLAIRPVPDIITSGQFGQLALKLVDKFDAKTTKPEVLVITGLYIFQRTSPLRETLPLLQAGYVSGVEVGDHQFAGYNAYGLGINSFWCGCNLATLAEETDVYYRSLQQLNHMTAANYIWVYWRAILNLLGHTEHTTRLSGEDLQEEMVLVQWQTANDVIGLFTFCIYKLMLCYLFGDFEAAHAQIEVGRQYPFTTIGSANVPLFYFYAALNALAGLQLDAENATEVLQQVDADLALLQSWASYAPMNYQHKVNLVEAEKCRVLGQKLEAIDYYDRAIAGAKANEYLQEEALANELTAKFYLDWGLDSVQPNSKEEIAAVYLKKAYYCYDRWGAKAKTRELADRYAYLLLPSLQQSNAVDPLATLHGIAPLKLSAHSSASRSQPATDHLNATLDLATLFKSAQALSESIDLNELLAKLAPMMLQTSGAERLTLLLPDADNVWHVKVTATAETTQLTSDPLTDKSQLPVQLIRYVQQTQEILAIDGREQSLPIVDSYLEQHPHRSVLCLPLLHQSKLVGLVYLDHQSLTGVFSRDRITILNFLCSQAAISLENALLNQALAQKLEVQTAKRQVSENRLRNMVDNIPGVVYQACFHTNGTDSVSYISPNSYALYGVSAEDMMSGKCRLRDFEHSEDSPIIDQILTSVNQTLQPFDHQFRIITASGILKWVHVIARPSPQPDGSTFWDGVVMDVSDRKATELALQDAQAQFHRMTENVPGVIYRYVLHANGSDEVTYVSSQVRELFEVEPEMAQQRLAYLWERIHPDDLGMVKAQMRHSSETQQPFKSEYRLVLPQKGLRWIQEVADPECLDNGDVVWDGVCIDVSDRKAAEQALIQHQIHLKALLNNIPHFVWLKDAHGRYIAVNETYEALYGITMADMVGLTDYEVWPIELAKAYVTDDAEVLASGQRKTSIGQFPRADGKLLWLEKTRTPFYDAKGQLAGTVGIAADITDRKTAELALQESEERFRRMTENVPGMIFRYVRHADGQDELTYVSSQVQDLFEVNPESALENTLWNRVHPDDVSRISHDVQVSAATLEPLTSIYRLILPAKGLRWVQNMASVERLENGDVVWDGIVIDISDRKQAELALEQEVLRRNAIFNTSSDGIHIIDIEGNLLEANTSFFQKLGYAPAEAKHLHVSDWDAKWSKEELKARLQRHLLHLPKVRIVDTLHRHKDGSIFPVEISTCLMEWNQQISFICIARDISERKQAEEQLHQTLAQLAASNNELEAFAYSISHDLRAPLRAINGFSQALLEDYSDRFDEDAEYYFERIQANANRMGRLIDDLLRLSRVSRSELSYTTVDLSALAQEVLHDLQSVEPDRSINLIVASGLTVLADSALMRIVMMNLLENAWKFTSEHTTARIEFGVLPPNSAASPDPIYFVKDDGAGFDMAYSHKLFGVFQRLHSFDEFPGTGIGLASVRRAIHRHGGQVWAEAAVQQGATIFFTVPSPSFQTPVE